MHSCGCLSPQVITINTSQFRLHGLQHVQRCGLENMCEHYWALAVEKRCKASTRKQLMSLCAPWPSGGNTLENLSVRTECRGALAKVMDERGAFLALHHKTKRSMHNVWPSEPSNPSLPNESPDQQQCRPDGLERSNSSATMYSHSNKDQVRRISIFSHLSSHGRRLCSISRVSTRAPNGWMALAITFWPTHPLKGRTRA